MNLALYLPPVLCCMLPVFDTEPSALEPHALADRPTRRSFVLSSDRLGGLMVKASASRAEDPGFESRLHRDFSGSSHTSDFKIGTPVTTLPGAWHYRVSAGTGRPGVSIL